MLLNKIYELFLRKNNERKYTRNQHISSVNLKRKIKEFRDNGINVYVSGVIKINGKIMKLEDTLIPPDSEIEIPILEFPTFKILSEEYKFTLDMFFFPFRPPIKTTLITAYGKTKEEAKKNYYEILDKYELIF